MRGACLTELPATIVGRTEAMEKRVDAALQAIRTVRPALEAFYATLSDEQKARLDSNAGRGRFWRWRDRWSALAAVFVDLSQRLRMMRRYAALQMARMRRPHNK